MKTQNELNAIKKEYEELSSKLHQLTEEELEQVAGGLTVKQYNIVLQNIGNRLKGILTDEQLREIIDKARELDQDDYERWAGDYAEKNGFDYNGISSLRIL